MATRLIGRTAVQNALLAASDDAVSGRTAAIAVEAGAGKTVLMEWLIDAAVGRRMKIVAARPVEGEPAWPWPSSST
ncbi:ATP-binding protein [Actinoplanes sp. NPDC023714]|uniref:ATP-binding protein n=1 Tax=Actinoplanes sp. NPDC023714 TaxID=3154322 RepID=UPI0033F92DA6